ncbi:NADH-quinone oxidoreductase subunit N [candidate division LCP-89 bacterium B3_LCP]|uniref:NADH-quinone oxidoreductase subunit N n=1 Tax=candidate division LCP-89 bacterium B3_LCP TaxID=2012998 RepID=A0A532USQ5_UNCL8|nr:MAG: NADH-quinone oxidoreductase subunit N [candidate division LCP-89 bacterium B3_LCP]
MNITYNLPAIGTQLVLGAGVILVLLADLLTGKKNRDVAYQTTLTVLVLAGIICVMKWGSAGAGFGGQVFGDGFASFFNLAFLAIAFLVVFNSPNYLKRNEIDHGEYYMLILIAVLGMTFMSSAGDLLIFFLGLETMSISLYVLAGFHKSRARSNESSLKYLLLGAFFTGFLLYGIALIYGQVGSTNLADITSYLAGSANPLGGYMGVGLALLLVGLLFKMAVVPFHFWSPDVYDGAPTPVTAFMSAAPKAAAFAAALRIFYDPAISLGLPWDKTLWIAAALTITLGNFAALAQSSIKRMLAYSSITHAGYLMIGLAAGNELGASGMLYYLFTYGFMNVGAFTIAWLVNRRGEGNYLLSDFAQLGSRNPVMALLMSIFMLSLTGIPPLAGFFGKLYVFSAGVKAGLIWLVVIAVLNSVVSVFYYLRVMVIMYMREEEGLKDLEKAPTVAITAILCGLVILLLGLFPGPLLDLARESVLSLL